MNKAVGVLNGAAAAGKSVANDLMTATSRVVDAATAAASSAGDATERHDWCDWRRSTAPPSGGIATPSPGAGATDGSTPS